MSKFLSSLLRVCLCTLGFSLANTSIALAQVTSDNTVNTQVTQNGNVAEITGGETRGANLFHSFQNFSVPTNNIADFQNADSISNIFSRVTGGNVSNIDGMIRANGSANLFLINPAGIMFGKNASLNIGGSFYGSSASSILFEDGEFSADLDNPPLLTVNAPIGLSFRANPGDIVVQGDGNGAKSFDSEVIDTQDALRVGSDATIGLVGGNILFEDATIKTAGGRIEIGSIAEGTVDLVAVDNGFTFDYSAIDTFRDISLSATSTIDASGLGGGNLQVTANNISLDGISTFQANTLGNQAGGEINIFAQESLAISGVENDLNFVSGISARTFPQGTADAGDINIETGTLSIGDRALIATSSSGQGNAGNININASESVTLASQGNTSTIFSGIAADAVGDAGNIKIASDSLSLNNGALISTINSGQGNAGKVAINAMGNISFNNSSSIRVTGSGRGSIDLNAANLSLTSGSQLFAGIFTDSGNADIQAGDIVVNLTEDLNIDNSSINNNIFEGTGNAGNVIVNARNINLSNGGLILNGNLGEGNIGDTILTATEDINIDGFNNDLTSGVSNFFANGASGKIGDINLTAQNLNLTNGGQITSGVEDTNNSGDINLNAADTILIEGSGFPTSSDGSQSELSSAIRSSVASGNGNSGSININSQNLVLREGGISSVNKGQGNAGDINANLDSLSITEGGTINASIEGSGQGGNIIINANQSISVAGNSESISFIAADIDPSATGEAGNIEINTSSLSVNNRSFISADVLGEGNGGSLKISASESVELSNLGLILATVFEDAVGNGGDITIETKQLTVADSSQINASTLGNGDAGNVIINASESVNLSGVSETSSGGIFASALVEDGNSGDINLTTDQLTISEGAIITASNFSSLGEENGGAAPGTGEPGNIFITANSLNIASGGRIQATTQAETGTGAEINLEIADSIFLSGDSFISARAFGNANGGNLTIDTNFIVAFEGDNDIIASAEQGQGGNINITAESLLGITAGTLSPFTNDINASSEFGLDGSVSLDVPDVNSVKGETELSMNILEPGSTTAQACQANREIAAQNGLVIKGKGGVPAPPEMPLNSTNLMIDGEIKDPVADSNLPQPLKTSRGKIQPARGIKLTDKGGIVLTAYRTNNQGDRLPQIETSCG